MHSSPRLTMPVSERDHTQGPADAPVTLVEYGDFQCPHCGRAFPIVEELLRKFAGRIRFVFRNFPLTEAHEFAEVAAEAAEAAAAQGRFWEMHHALFTHQNALEPSHLLQYAGKLGIDARKFAEALESRAFKDRVREDFLSGARSGVNGTPTFFLNGFRYDGSWDLPDFANVIEEVIAKS